MKNIYGEKLRSASVFFAKAQKMAKILEEIVRSYTSQVTAEWDLSQDDNSRPVVTLTISDWTGAKSTQFTQWELDQPWEVDPHSPLRIGLYHLWGEMLQVRSEKQLQELMGTGGEGK